MRRVVAGLIVGTAVMVAALGPGVPVRAVEIAETAQDQTFRLEWAKEGRRVNGYVYNPTSRYAAYMQLLVAGVDGSGSVVNTTKTWVRDVPPNNRAYFDVSVPDAAAYRVSILSFKWIQEIASIVDGAM